MKQISTPDLLLLHLYNETSAGQQEMLAEKISKDVSLQEELMELVRIKRRLNKGILSPSDTSVRIIMEHSRKTEHLQEI